MLNVSKEVLAEMGREYGGDLIRDWLEMFCIDVSVDECDCLFIDDDDHALLCGVDNVRDGHGNWTQCNKLTEKFVHMHGDAIYKILCGEANNLGVKLCTLLERIGLGNELSWTVESILKGEDVESNGIDRAVGWYIGNKLVYQYQELVESRQ